MTNASIVWWMICRTNRRILKTQENRALRNAVNAYVNNQSIKDDLNLKDRITRMREWTEVTFDKPSTHPDPLLRELLNHDTRFVDKIQKAK